MKQVSLIGMGLAVLAFLSYTIIPKEADASLTVYGVQSNGIVQIFGPRLQKGDRILIYQYYYKEYLPWSEYAGTVVPKKKPLVKGTVVEMVSHGIALVKPDRDIVFPVTSKIRARKI